MNAGIWSTDSGLLNFSPCFIDNLVIKLVDTEPLANLRLNRVPNST